MDDNESGRSDAEIDDDENDRDFLIGLTNDLAAQKAAIMAILRVLEDIRPTAATHVADALSEQAKRIGSIASDTAETLADALDDFADEIRVQM
jgi:hypothetical protein